MSISSNDGIFGVNAYRTYVGVGATVAMFLDVVAGQTYTRIKYMNGGTLEILPATSGTTMSAAQLAAVGGSGYLMGTTEVLELWGPTRLYLSATGATTLVSVLQGKTQGT